MDRCSTTRRCLLGRVRLRPCLAANLQDRAPLVGPPRLCWRGALGQTPPPLARRCARTAVLIRLRRRSPCRRTPCRRSPRRPSAGDQSEAASFHVAGVCRVHPQCRRRQPRPAGSDRRTRSGEPPRLVGGPRAAAAAPRPRLGATGPAPCAPPTERRVAAKHSSALLRTPPRVHCGRTTWAGWRGWVGCCDLRW
jgi:hypothetical protein